MSILFREACEVERMNDKKVCDAYIRTMDISKKMEYSVQRGKTERDFLRIFITYSTLLLTLYVLLLVLG